MRRFLTSLVFATAALVALPAGAADPFEEPSVRTDHQIDLDGALWHYTTETGRIAIRDAETGEPHGQMFYTAYRVPGEKSRPVAFIWNGGPGSNSALLHFEAAGPRRLVDGGLVDNQDTWLTDMDLVFVDPIGTGFSRPTEAEYADEFYGTIGDVASVTEFVRAWRLLHDAESAPLLLIGESWGAGRAGSVGYRLEQQGIPVHALVLISGGSGLADNPVPASLRRALWVVDLSMTALQHDRLPADLGRSPQAVRAAAEQWARQVYAPALDHPDTLNDEEREAVLQGLTRFTGIPAAAVEGETLRITPRAYRENLLGEEGPDLQLFDMRLTVDDDEPDDRQALVRTLTGYLRHTLGYETSLPYVSLELLDQAYAPSGEFPASVGSRWNYATAELTPEETEAAYQEAMRTGAGPPKLGPPLPSAAEAVGLDPAIRVWVVAGRYDSLNSCSANEELGRRLEGTLASAYTFACYEGGHMVYRDPEARAALARDVRGLAKAAR